MSSQYTAVAAPALALLLPRCHPPSSDPPPLPLFLLHSATKVNVLAPTPGGGGLTLSTLQTTEAGPAASSLLPTPAFPGRLGEHWPLSLSRLSLIIRPWHQRLWSDDAQSIGWRYVHWSNWQNPYYCFLSTSKFSAQFHLTQTMEINIFWP